MGQLQDAGQEPESAVALVVSPGGRLHAYRQGALATVCGLTFKRRYWSRRGDGWYRIRGDFDRYVRLGDGRTCSNCSDGLELGTGPGARRPVPAGE